MVIIRHKDDILSVYKNAASVTKTQGNIVKSGEVIALAGNTNSVLIQVLHCILNYGKDGFQLIQRNLSISINMSVKAFAAKLFAKRIHAKTKNGLIILLKPNKSFEELIREATQTQFGKRPRF